MSKEIFLKKNIDNRSYMNFPLFVMYGGETYFESFLGIFKATLDKTAFQRHFQKQKPKSINHYDYSNFSKKEYRQQILYELSLASNV